MTTPRLDSLASYHAVQPGLVEKNVEIVLISIVGVEETTTFVQVNAIRLPVLIAPTNTIPFMSNYKLQSTPSYCFIDENGKIISCGHPGKNASEIKAITAS